MNDSPVIARCLWVAEDGEDLRLLSLPAFFVEQMPQLFEGDRAV